MTEDQFHAHRTTLANNFAAAGAELLEFMRAPGTLAAIPNTSPDQYVVAGDLVAIQALLPNRRERRGQRPTDELYFGPEAGQPRRWSILITESGKGVVADYGHRFPGASAELERVDVVEFSPSTANKAAEEGELSEEELKAVAEEAAHLTCRYSDAVLNFYTLREQIEKQLRHIFSSRSADRASRQVASFDSAIYQVEQHDGDWCDCDKEFFDKQPDERRRVVFSRQVANKAEVEPELRAEIEKLTHYKHCMSYNDSYFGEPAGLVKQVAYQLDRLISAKEFHVDEPYSAKLAERGASVAEVRAAERVEAMHKGVVGVLAGVKAEALATLPATTGASTANGEELAEEILSLHRQLAAEKLRANQGWERAESKSRECLDLRERMASADPASTVLTGERIENAALDHATGLVDSHWCFNHADLLKFSREVAAQAGQVAVPEGWKLVPVEPNAEMLVAGAESEDPDFGIVIHNCYQAMLAAAPSAPAVAQQAPLDFRNVTAVKRISDQSLTITFASCRACSQFERAAAPSPAKESK